MAIQRGAAPTFYVSGLYVNLFCSHQLHTIRGTRKGIKQKLILHAESGLADGGQFMCKCAHPPAALTTSNK